MLVNEDQTLDQVMKQVRKLEDVLDVQRRNEKLEAFARLEAFINSDIPSTMQGLERHPELGRGRKHPLSG